MLVLIREGGIGGDSVVEYSIHCTVSLTPFSWVIFVISAAQLISLFVQERPDPHPASYLANQGLSNQFSRQDRMVSAKSLK